MTLLFAFLIGLFAGLRSLTPPAVVAWAVYLGWLKLARPLSLIGSLPAVIILSLLAIIELILDKLPNTPNRTAPLRTYRPHRDRWLNGRMCFSWRWTVGFRWGWAGTDRRNRRLFRRLSGPRSARKVPAPARFQHCFARGLGCDRWQSVHRFAILVRLARQWE